MIDDMINFNMYTVSYISRDDYHIGVLKNWGFVFGLIFSFKPEVYKYPALDLEVQSEHMRTVSNDLRI